MPTFTMTKNWDDGTTLTESQLDDIKTSVETFLNTTKIDSTNIQTGGIATANYAAASVDAAALGSSAVTTAKINDLAVTTAKINDLGVTTAKIAAANVTRAKLEALGHQISSSTGTFSTTSTTFVDVTNATVTITTSGRPVVLSMISDITDPSVDHADIGIASAGAGANGTFRWVRDATTISATRLSTTMTGNTLFVPPGALFHIDRPSAGTYVYKLQCCDILSFSSTVYVRNLKVLAYEL